MFRLSFCFDSSSRNTKQTRLKIWNLGFQKMLFLYKIAVGFCKSLAKNLICILPVRRIDIYVDFVIIFLREFYLSGSRFSDVHL
jgi:hypothetical protein